MPSHPTFRSGQARGRIQEAAGRDERYDRRAFLRRSATAGIALAGAGVLLPMLDCSSSPKDPPSCGLGCAGDVDHLEASIGHPLRYQRIYHRAEPFPGPEEQAAWSAGRYPVSSFKTLRADGSPVPFADVMNGAADTQLLSLANAIRPSGSRPMLLLYFPEPEDDVADAPQDFAPAFRHVRDVMGDLGTGVKWAHTLSHPAYTEGLGDLYYPGDDYVDYITCDGYNWCPDAGHGTTKRTFSQLFTATNGFAEEKRKEWFVTEVGSWDDPAPGWSKASWIEGMGRTAKRWPALRGIMWFNHDLADGFLCDWRIEDTPTAVDAFGALASEPYFRG